VMQIDSQSKNFDNFDLGIRALAGWEIFFKDSPASFFVEGSGNLYFFTRFFPDWNASIGIRYYLAR
jgi:hypothetical protein